MKQADVPADPQPVTLDRSFAAAVYNGVHAQEPAADFRLAQPDRGPVGRARARPVRAGHMTAGQVEVPANPDAVPKQPGNPGATRQNQFVQPGALEDERRVKLAIVEPQRERHIEPAQLQGAHDESSVQPQPPGINLVLQLTTAPAKQRRVHGPAGCAIRAVNNEPGGTGR